MEKGTGDIFNNIQNERRLPKHCQIYKLHENRLILFMIIEIGNKLPKAAKNGNTLDLDYLHLKIFSFPFV